MKYLYSIVALLLMTPILYGQADPAIKSTDDTCRAIRKNLSAFRVKTVDIPDESTDGGEMKGYYDGTVLKYIEATWFGESGKRVTEYYFDKGRLIYVSDRNFEYNVPYYTDAETAKENGTTETFDPEKTIVTEDRYYFKNEKLFLWLDNNKASVDLSMGTNSITGQGLVAHTHKLIDKLGK
ncbi:hypothetical protein OGH69_02305 [Flavobacterium sp. MFBS3-15]|uniref:hypothetical protein n=1 Tax=Flavobacterium sp. MFBS3-15 TaxID=2989816 RepID=UPI0022369342|nr:hypothetical protein [Flavobacterium sp. MFBS3-15]MCW4467782.1 hypothetical protein [Flavobacterium sp. MFBS3-15]